MPTKFNPVLSGPQNPSPRTDPYTDNLTEVAGQYAAGVESLGQLQDQRILDKYAGQSAGVTDSTADFASQMKDLNYKAHQAGLRNDGKAVAAYEAQMHKLRSGELNGVMSPTSASVRLQSLTKEYVTRYPHLSEEFKKLYNAGAAGLGGSSGSSGGGADADPTWKAVAGIREEAVARDVSDAEILRRRREEDAVAALELEIKKSTLLGTKAEPQLEQIFGVQADRTVAAAWDVLRKQFSAGELNKGDWAVGIGQAFSEYEVQFNREIAAYERDTGGRVDPKWREAQLAKVKGQFDGLLAAAEKADSADNMGRIAGAHITARTNLTQGELLKLLGGPVGYALADKPEVMALLDKWGTIIKFQKGNPVEQELISNLLESDPAAAAIYLAMSKQGFTDFSGRYMGSAILNGTEYAPPQDPVLRGAVGAQLGQMLRTPGMEPEQYDSIALAYVKNDPSKVTDPVVASRMRSNPKLATNVLSSVSARVEAAGAELDPHEFPLIDPAGGKGETPAAGVANDKDTEKGGYLDPTGDFFNPRMVAEQAPNVVRFTDSLNTYYKGLVASGLSPAEAKEKVKVKYTEVFEDRKESATRLARQEAEAAVAAVAPKSDTDRTASLADAITQAASGYAPGDRADSPTGKPSISAALASRLLREISSDGDDPSITEMSDGVFQDALTGTLIEIKNGAVRVVKLNK